MLVHMGYTKGSLALYEIQIEFYDQVSVILIIELRDEYAYPPFLQI
jgi:hypothetical protein